MKTFPLIFLCASAVGQLTSISESEESLPLAFENVTNHLFRLETQMFIKNFGIDRQTMTWLMLKDLNEKGMPFSLQNLEINNKTIGHNSSALITFSSYEDLRDFNKNLNLTNEYYRPLQLFVYCQDASIKDIKSLSKDVSEKLSNAAEPFYFSGGIVNGEQTPQEFILTRRDLRDIIQYEYFLIDDDKFVRLMTFLWYSPGHCGELHLVEVNRFNKLTKKWENDKFVSEKLKNFHNCEVRFFALYEPESDFYLTILTKLSGHLNYRLDLSEINTIQDGIAKRGCYEGNHRTYLNSTRSYILNFLTFPVEYLEQRIAVPPGGKYSEYEKLVMPFDLFTWVLIASTFLASFLTILILYFVKRSIRDFICGENVASPALNVVQIFFGISQVVVPRRNFARYLTMLFIIFCLIIRTAWQGKMYEFMQKDVLKPELQTVDEMIEKDYTFYAKEYFQDLSKESQIVKRGIYNESRDYVEVMQMLNKQIFEPDFKGVIVSDIYYEYWMTFYTDEPFQERLKKEILNVEMCGMVFPRHHHFVGIFDEMSLRLFDSGIITYEIKSIPRLFEGYYGFIERSRAKRPKNDQPKVLNMLMLEPGFVIWLASLPLTFIAFLLEWLNTLKDYIVCKYIFRAFFRVQNGFGH